MKKGFSKIFILLLVVGLLFAAAPTKQALAATPTTLNVAQWSAETNIGINGRPTVLYDGANYHMWYGVGDDRLFHSTASTPTGFAAGTENTFTGGPTGAPYERSSVTVVKEGDFFYLITYGATDKIFSIYTSSVSDGNVWTYKNDVFDGTGLETYDLTWQKFDAPSLLADGGAYKLYFQVKPTDGVSYSIFMAQSGETTLADMADNNNDNDFTLANSSQPVLTKGATGESDEIRVMHPNVVKNGDTYYMWYAGVKTGAYFSQNYAYSSDGIHWTKGLGNPIQASTLGDYAEPSVVVVGDTWNLWYMFGGNPIKHVSATGPFEFQTIQDAIDAATSGDTINVAAGTYAENVDVTKPVTLLGPNAGVAGNGTRVAEAVIQGTADSWVGLYVEPNIPGVTIKGFKFDGANLFDPTYTVGVAGDSSGLTVQNNVFVNHDGMAIMTSGVYTLDDGETWLYDKWLTDILIKDNLITNTTLSTSGYNFGIYFQSSLGIVSGNVVTNMRNGIQVQPYWNTPGGGVISGNTFEAYRTGIYFNYTENASADWEFTDNLIQGIAYPTGLTADKFNAILVQTFSDGQVDFGYNQVLLGTSNATEQHLYFEIDVTGGTSSATPNWWGSITGPAAGSFVGVADYLPYCTNPECTEFSQAALYMTPATADLACGGTDYVVEVMVKDVVDLQSYALKLQFDHTRIQIISVENGGFLAAPGMESFGNDLGNDDGLMTWGWAPTGVRQIDGSGSLIKITFEPTNIAGTSAFTILPDSMLVDWPESQEVPFAITGSASVTTGSIVTNTKSTSDVADDVSYCDLALAVAQAEDGDTLRADANFTIPAMVTVDEALTLDLNGKTLTATSTALDVIGGGALTIDDLSTGDAGEIIAGYRGAQVSAGGSLNLKKGTLAGNGFDGVFVFGEGSSLTVDGGAITGLYYGISGNGSDTAPYDGATSITITGGTVQGGETAIFHPEEGLLKITGGTITGGTYNGIEMKAGDLEITGGTITTSAAYVATPLQTGNGNTQSGDAILIYNRAGYQGTMTVKITGGTITSTYGYALREYTYVGEASRTTLIDISGGSFTGGIDPDSGDTVEYANKAVTFMTIDPAVLKLTDGQYNTDPGIAGADFVYTPYDTYISGSWFMIDPVDITATTLAGTFTAGLPTTVTITIADTDHTGPFEVVFTYPEGTSITFGTNTYVCTSTGCPVITVTLSDPGPTTLSFAVTLPGVGPYDVSVALNHVAGATDIRLLDSDSATGVVASGNFNVSGTITMQGRPGILNGIPVTLYWDSTFATYGPSMETDTLPVNFHLPVTYGGTYKFTTLQPCYLNITAEMLKTFTVAGDKTINSLWLRAGNAVWLAVDANGNLIGGYDNAINSADTVRVGLDWAKTGTDLPALDQNSGDVNIDGKVNIQDLTLVGGNMGLTSTTAYSTWMP